LIFFLFWLWFLFFSYNKKMMAVCFFCLGFFFIQEMFSFFHHFSFCINVPGKQLSSFFTFSRSPHIFLFPLFKCVWWFSFF
jgi:hypothetical protein